MSALQFFDDGSVFVCHDASPLVAASLAELSADCEARALWSRLAFDATLADDMPDDDDKPAPIPFTVDVTVDRTRVQVTLLLRPGTTVTRRGNKDHDRARAEPGTLTCAGLSPFGLRVSTRSFCRVDDGMRLASVRWTSSRLLKKVGHGFAGSSDAAYPKQFGGR